MSKTFVCRLLGNNLSCSYEQMKKQFRRLLRERTFKGTCHLSSDPPLSAHLGTRKKKYIYMYIIQTPDSKQNNNLPL